LPKGLTGVDYSVLQKLQAPIGVGFGLFTTRKCPSLLDFLTQCPNKSLIFN